MRRNVLQLVLVACLSGALLLAASGAGEASADASGPAADFSLPSRGGQSVSLSALRGQVVLINFWATWCGPCRKEMPLLEQIQKKYAPLGFVMLGINVEEDTTHMEAFLGDVPVTFPVLLDPANRVSKLYDVAAMPSTVIVDRKGNIRYIHQGYQPGDESRYQDVIRQLIRERT
ncbi:MAG: TlpA family protein disulfide reductase [Gammaproteobacteria bacterium]|nr:TlpA family protein disulfide reductase [Gammaproteobacteria bacterium]